MSLSKKKKQVLSAWEDFFILNKEEVNGISEVIKESWIRSKNYGIDLYQNDFDDATDLARQAESVGKHGYFIDIARPYMVDLFNIIKESGFVITLTDKDGYILDTITSPGIENTNIRLVNMNEKKLGTNAIGTCLYLDRPVETFAEEYCCVVLHQFSTSAAPIHDRSGRLLGSIGITGFANVLPLHTLGMATAIAYAIENQISLSLNGNVNSVVQNYTHFINQSVSDGIIVVDLQGNITSINKAAMGILGVESGSAIGAGINDIVKGPVDFRLIMNEDLNFYNNEFTLSLTNKTIRCQISVTNLKNGVETIGLVIVIKETGRPPSEISGKKENSLFSFKDIIGESEATKNTIKLAVTAARGKSNVLIIGESGTGKELYAQSIHNDSFRRDKPFVAVNCGALPVNLAESELFGYEGGSYTGSRREGHKGKFESADGGTIFLDEIGDMPLATQASLLRIIQDKNVVRVGGTKGKSVDVRIIAATNKNLFEAVRNNTFRIDLFYRLNVFTINLPPLRERKDDILPLIDFFMRKFNERFSSDIKGLTDEALETMLNYDWFGNVRELENTIERAVQIAQGQTIDVKDLPVYIQNIPVNKPGNMNREVGMAELSEYHAIEDALERNRGNIRLASEQLKISRATVYRKLSKFGADPDRFRR
ncbi:MAG TPA: sigma 54-interacting transcriptional regulator [Anaerovoracaceae bacterium]|nr:sigma 54-interacting transcriptional regulator [Anaerovoracaceae bacterium]